jgi:nuclear pore complex protein Nup133
MFSAVSEGGPATATRSRRRQRPLSSDSLVQQPKAKRQRVPLSEQTFVNPDVAPEMFEVKADRVATLDLRQDGIENFAVPPRKELQVRAKKPKAADRAGKGDGSAVLVSISIEAGRVLLMLTRAPVPQHRVHGQQAASST